MNIAYVLGPECYFSTKGHGVKMQASVWADVLKNKGHDIKFITPWETYDLASFDVIHIFGYGLWLGEFIKRIYRKNRNIVLSPIIDSISSKFACKLASYCAIPKFRLYSTNYMLRTSGKYIRQFYIRSDYEGQFLTHSYGIDSTKLIKIPLSCRFDVPNNEGNKEDFCLSVSSICNSRKNVVRLIKAANKYGFKLKLAGNPGTQTEFEPLRKAIGNNPNIEVLGFVSQEKLHSLYQRAKVFALPSIIEGVGLSALEAAVFGCDVVITKLGGPKEYYDKYAYVVDPFSIDSIGEGVMNAFRLSKQPYLQNHILNNYSIEKTVSNLEKGYLSL